MEMEVLKNPRKGFGFKHDVKCHICKGITTRYVVILNTEELYVQICKKCLVNMINKINKSILED